MSLELHNSKIKTIMSELLFFNFYFLYFQVNLFKDLKYCYNYMHRNFFQTSRTQGICAADLRKIT